MLMLCLLTEPGDQLKKMKWNFDKKMYDTSVLVYIYVIIISGIRRVTPTKNKFFNMIFRQFIDVVSILGVA